MGLIDLKSVVRGMAQGLLCAWILFEVGGTVGRISTPYIETTAIDTFNTKRGCMIASLDMRAKQEDDIITSSLCMPDTLLTKDGRLKRELAVSVLSNAAERFRQ